MVSAVVMGNILPLGHHPGLHRQPGRMVVFVPLGQAPEQRYRIITAITPKIRKKTISNPPPKKKLSIMPHASLSGGNAPVYVVLLYAPPGGNATNLRLRREEFPESGRKPQVAWYFYPV